MLPRSARLTSPNDFARVTKSGFRASSKFLVVYLYLTSSDAPARCGLIISKNAGGSVVRHKLSRQLRHGIKEHLPSLPEGSLVVIRALPGLSTVNVGQELNHLVPKVLEKAKAAK